MSPLLKKRANETSEQFLLRKYCLLSAGLAGLVMIIFYIFHNNTLVFGDATVLRMDLYHQYGPLYAEVYDRLTSGSSLIYSWNSGLGSGFLGNLFNYCSSPFALVLLLLGHKNMPEAIAIMIMLKAMLASTGVTYYLNKSNRCVRQESVIFGLMYAFSGYFVAFSWNIMWFDAVAVFPFVILGIERIINHNKPLTYILAMTYTMITNYYMAYMVCILSVMYFIYYYFGRYEFTSKIFKVKVEDAETETVAAVLTSDENTDNEQAFTEQLVTENSETAVNNKVKKKAKKKFADNRFWVTGWSFALSSFLCFALAAFALLPVYYCLQTSSATADELPESAKIYFDIFTFIANHFTGVEATIRSSGNNVIPNVYCGLLSVILLPIYFASNKIPGRQKIASAILLMTCFCGFALNYFNFIWHGFHMPNDLPYRWSFAYSFFLIIIAFKAFRQIEEFSRKVFVGIGFALMLFIVLMQKFEIPNCEDVTIILSVIFTLIYVVVIGMMTSPRYTRKTITGLLTFMVILELVAADAPKIVMQQPKDAYASDYESFKEIQLLTEEDEDELFFRSELTKLRTRMDTSWYGYYGTSIFSSMAYDHTAKLMEKLGFFGNNINSYTYYPQTPLFNSMFSIKYLYDNKSDILKFDGNDKYYTSVGSNDTFEALQYNYYLPLVFAVDENIKEWNNVSANPFMYQNSLAEATAGISDMFISAPATSFSGENIKDVAVSAINGATSFSVSKSSNGSKGTANVIITPETDGNYYVYAGSTSLSSIKITAGENEYNYASTSIQPFLLDVGYLTTDDKISVSYVIPEDKNTATLTFAAARIDDEAFDSAYNKFLANGTLEMDSFDEDEFSGTINVKEDGDVLWTSIPYDESWEIYLDGKLLTYTEIDEETQEVIVDGEIFKIGGGLIGIEAQKGEHTISFKYSPNGLSTGLLLTASALIALGILLVYKLLLQEKLAEKGFVPVFLRKPDYFED